MSEWMGRHPAAAVLSFSAAVLLGGAAGVGAAYAGDALHVISPGNVAAGSLLGIGGVWAGFAVWALAAWLLHRVPGDR